MTELLEGLPGNYEQLKKQANNKSDWRKRKAAIQELGKYKGKQVEDILWRRMMSDKVYSVVETAFRLLQARDAKGAKGKPLKLPRKPKGNLIKGINSELSKVKNALPEEHSFEEFKEALKGRKPEIYDTYEGDKGNRFDKWLNNTWTTLPKKKV